MRAKLYKSSIDCYYNTIYIENELGNINRTIDLFDKLINENDIVFGEYIDIINRIYNVNISNNDLIRISSCILNGYSKTSILNTDILCKNTKRSQIDNGFEYFDEEGKLYVNAAFTDGIDNLEHVYSYDELVKLVNDKKIVILDLIIDDDERYYEDISEYRELTSLKKITSNGFINLKYVRNDYISPIYCFLKSYFSLDKLKNDFDIYMKDIRDKFDMIQNYIYGLKKGYASKNLELDDILTMCNKIKKKNK